MEIEQVNLEIKRSDGRLIEAKVMMPTWTKLCDDGSIQVILPLLGDVITFAKDENDIENAVKEAFGCFCVMAEKFGNGIENELKLLGWKKQPNKKHFVLLNYKTNEPVIKSIAKTGHGMAFSFNTTTTKIFA